MSDRGFTLIELMIVVAIIGILSAVNIPTFVNQAQPHRESNAISTLVKINSEQGLFMQSDPDGDAVADFAVDFGELATASASANVIDLLAGNGGAQPGYQIAMTGSAFAWSATATPTIATYRSFFIDESGIIRALVGPGANASSPPL
jgi:prepilin-type N-terminal cleavage/methylation domain-containing protein